MRKTRQQSKQSNTNTIDLYFGKGKKQQKNVKTAAKQFVKDTPKGTIRIGFKKELYNYKQLLMSELQYEELGKQLKQFLGEVLPRGMLKHILYSTISRTTEEWSQIYAPESIEDLLSQENADKLMSWIENSYRALRKNRSHMSEYEESSQIEHCAEQTDEQNYGYKLLNLHGCTGKMSTLNSIARGRGFEIIYTYDYTERKTFEELFQSENISFGASQNKQSQTTEVNGTKRQKKFIVHRGPLPKFFNLIVKEQRVPFIWVTDELKNEKSFDEYELKQYSLTISAIFVFLIIIIEENYKDQIKGLTQQLRDKFTYQSIIDGCFFKSIGIQPNPSIEINPIRTTITLKQVNKLLQTMNGNIRCALNWLQFHYSDDNFEQLLDEQLRQVIPLEIKMKNQLKLKLRKCDNTRKSEYLRRSEDLLQTEDREIECNEIIQKRLSLPYNDFRYSYPYKSIDVYLSNQTLKSIAFTTPQAQMTRRTKHPDYDPYKPLSQYFPSYELFKWFDQLQFFEDEQLI